MQYLKNLCRPDGERRVTNFLHLAEVLHRATINNRSHLRPYLFGLEQKWSKRISLKMSIN